MVDEIQQKEDMAQDDSLQQLLKKVVSGGGDREFLVPASDKRGHSEVVNFRAQPTWKRLVEVIVTARYFPYKTPSDFLRHAIITHVQYLDSLKGLPEKTQGLLMQQMAIDEVLKDEAVRRNFDLSMAELGEAVKNRREIGDEQGAKQLVNTIYSLIDAIHDEEQRKLHVGRLRKEFGYLLPRRPLHPLEDMVDEEGEQEGLR